jgi:hypothetical protein
MKIGERGGVVAVLSRWISPLFSRLFPGVPKGHPALGSMFMNVSANMLGLDNAATPLGLKAMRELQELNPNILAETFMNIDPKAGCPLGTPGKSRENNGLIQRDKTATTPPRSPIFIVRATT